MILFCIFSQWQFQWTLKLLLFKAAQLAFPGTQIFGYFFHFVKNMKKDLTQEPDATRRYRNDADFSLYCKCVAAVAFVPLQRIDEAMAHTANPPSTRVPVFTGLA